MNVKRNHQNISFGEKKQGTNNIASHVFLKRYILVHLYELLNRSRRMNKLLTMVSLQKKRDLFFILYLFILFKIFTLYITFMKKKLKHMSVIVNEFSVG